MTTGEGQSKSYTYSNYSFKGAATNWYLNSASGGATAYYYEAVWYIDSTDSISSQYNDVTSLSCTCTNTASCNSDTSQLCMSSITDSTLNSQGATCSCSDGDSCYVGGACIVPTCDSCTPDGCVTSSKTCLSNYIASPCLDTNSEYIIDACQCKSGYTQYSSNPVRCALTKANCSTYDSSGCIQCNTGYYLDSSNTPQCIECGFNCNECTSASCTVCNTGYAVKSDPTSCDTCASDYFQETSSTCSPCPSTCTACTSYNFCSACKDPYLLLESSSSSTCISTCPDGYYNNLNSICKECSTNCAVCSTSTVCEVCDLGYYLYSQSSSTVCVSTCPSGYYLNYLKTSCDLCSLSNCSICQANVDVVICSKCQDGYYLMNNQCKKCDKNQYSDGVGCEDCPKTCSSCTSASVCTSCVQDYMIDGDICIQILAFELSYNSGVITIEFDKKLASSLSVSDFTLKIDGVELDSSEFILLTSEDNKTFSIQLVNYNNIQKIEVILGKTISGQNNSQLDTFSDYLDIGDSDVDPDSDVDTNDDDKSEDSKSDSTNQSQSDYLAQNSNAQLLNSRAATASKAAVSGAVMFGITVPTGIWSFINTLQLMSLIPMLNIDMPIILFGLLSGLRGYSPIPNLVSYMMDTEGPKPYDKAILMGYDSSQFLLNSGDMLTGLFISILLFPVFFLFRKLLPAKFSTTWIYKFFLSCLLDYKWNVFTRFFVESYIEIAIAAIMQIWEAGDSSIYESGNLTTNLVFCLPVLVISIQALVCSFPMLLLYFIYNNYKKVEDESFAHRWGTFFSEFDKSKGLVAYLYYVIFTSRRLLLVLCFFGLRGLPHTQAVCASLIGWMVRYIQMFAYIVKYRPFEEKIINGLNILIEFNIAASYSLASFFLFGISGTASDAIIYTIASLIASSILANLSVMVFMTVRDIIRYVIRRRAARRVDDIGKLSNPLAVLTFRVNSPNSGISVLKEEEFIFSKITPPDNSPGLKDDENIERQSNNETFINLSEMNETVDNGYRCEINTWNEPEGPLILHEI